MSVKRYEPCFSHAGKDRDGLFEHPQGRLVMHTDYAELEKRVFEMQNAAIDLAMQNKALKAKLDAYRSKTEGDK